VDNALPKPVPQPCDPWISIGELAFCISCAVALCKPGCGLIPDSSRRFILLMAFQLVVSFQLDVTLVAHQSELVHSSRFVRG
jgi:hypothetical protein